MELDTDLIIDWVRDQIGEIVSGFCIFILIILMLLLKRQYTIGILGLISIIAIAIERRAKAFDKIVSVLVIFCLAVGFMLFD